MNVSKRSVDAVDAVGRKLRVDVEHRMLRKLAHDLERGEMPIGEFVQFVKSYVELRKADAALGRNLAALQLARARAAGGRTGAWRRKDRPAGDGRLNASDFRERIKEAVKALYGMDASEAEAVRNELRIASGE